MRLLRSAAFILITFPLVCFPQGQKKTAAYFFQKGEEAMDVQSYKTALAHFNECLRLDPYYMEAYYYRAQIRESMGDSKGALTDFNIYLESKPQNTEALFSRAMLRYQYAQWAMAREDFLKLLQSPAGETRSVFFATDRESGNPIVTTQSNMTSSVLNYLGLVDTKMKNFDRAVKYMDSAIRLDQKNPEFYINRGYAFQEMKDTLRATQDYEKALALNPETSLARHNLAVLSAKKGNLKEVERLLTEAIERSPQNALYFTARGINYTAQGDIAKAIADYSTSIHFDNTNPEVWMRRGLLKQKQKDLNGALTDFTQSIKLKDDNEKIWICRGNLMLELKRAKEAVEDFTIACTLKPEFGLAYFSRAIAHQRNGNLKDGCEDLKKAQSLNFPVDEKVKTSICK
ncbi:MAG TPA: tetratricopeptide repeat protein [Cyclobacteriaceae bacterium]|jgi:tetratricopeptide (TPR) repeat protein|nr:tetratricopeptide repeat protein [Cyclobacteriaceae bacterium]